MVIGTRCFLGSPVLLRGLEDGRDSEWGWARAGYGGLMKKTGGERVVFETWSRSK